MWKTYLRQIRYLLKENKFFSLVYILGTALSITMIMLILITYYINTANIGVEDKRDRMFFFTRAYVVKPGTDATGDKFYDGFQSSSPVGHKLIEKYMYPLKTPEAKSLVVNMQSVVYNKTKQVNEGMSAISTDADFWKMFSMRFLAGGPFSDVDVKSNARKVVIDESTARALFGKTDVVNYPIDIDWKEYRVCGVVEDVPSYLSDAYAHLWFPYTTATSRFFRGGTNDLKDIQGPAKMYLLGYERSDQELIRQEMEHQIQKLNAPAKKSHFTLNHQPDTALESLFRMSSDPYDKIYTRMQVVLVVIIVLLILPALNLSGLIVARMKKRGEEIGVRKAFGASVWNIMGQLFLENFVQMLIGGIIGLCLSCGLFQLVRNTLLVSYRTAGNDLSVNGVDVLNFFHIINFSTICYVILICFLLNLISTLLPAWRYARISIVEALNRR